MSGQSSCDWQRHSCPIRGPSPLVAAIEFSSREYWGIRARLLKLYAETNSARAVPEREAEDDELGCGVLFYVVLFCCAT